MDIESLRDYCLKKNAVKESFPFGETALVFKVREKMFLLASLDSMPLQFNVKCDPDEAELLREQYPAIQPGYHMNKRHWNTVTIDGTIPEKLLRSMIDDSYRLVVESLPLKKRQGLL